MIRIRSFFEKNQDFTAISPPNKQAGSAIILIFIMIALFAALSFTVSRSMRGGAGKIDKEQAQLAASEILSYSRSIKNAVHELQINGCSDTEISFENNVVSGYINPNAPTDKSCHVFNSAGGGLRYRAPDIKWLDTINTASSHYNTWYTNSSGWVVGLGTDGSGSQCLGGATDGSCRELITGIPFIKKEICIAINKKLGWGTENNGTPFKDIGSSYGANPSKFFNGTYGTGYRMGDATSSGYSNVTTGCIEGDTDPSSGTYSFFQVLIAR